MVVIAVWVAFVVGAVFGFWLAGGFLPRPRIHTIADTRPPTRVEIDAGALLMSPTFPCLGCSECQPPKEAKG